MRQPAASLRGSRGLRWLRGSAADRARFADMSRRFRNASLFGALMGAANTIAAWWYGPAQLVTVAVAVLVMALATPLARRSRARELVAAVAFLLLELDTAAAVLLSGGAHSPLLPLLAVPVFSQAVCFRPPVFLTSMVVSGALAVPATLLAPRAGSGPDLLHLFCYLVLLGCLAAPAQFLAASDLTSRDEAVADPMTGLLNRSSLPARFAELQEAARTTGGAVGLVMVDVDHFKRINDTHGHARGDAVLRELAERLRGSLRDTDLAFRVGGEEFVVLLPGQDLGTATARAERLRAAVAATPLAGLPVTVSAGIASSGDGTVGLAELLRAADRALYAAKDGGRDRVVAAGAHGATVPAGPA